MAGSEHWWAPEAYSHHFGKTLAEIEIPWTVNVIDLLQMKLAYARLLRAILVHDADACSVH